jgi:DNA-binding NtrC family response regulator
MRIQTAGLSNGTKATRVAPIVLIAEDCAFFRNFVATVLRGQDYQILMAETSEVALKLSKEPGKIDLLISDIVMPGMTGINLAERIKASRPKTGVLLISEHEPDALIKAEWHFLSKPFTPAKLRQIVSDILGRHPRSGPMYRETGGALPPQSEMKAS